MFRLIQVFDQMQERSERFMSFFDFLKVQKQGLESLATVGTIGLHMVSGPLVGVAIGYFLDEWLDTGPWLKLVFLIIGIGAGFLNVYVDTRMLVNRLDRQAGRGSTSPRADSRNSDTNRNGNSDG